MIIMSEKSNNTPQVLNKLSVFTKRPLSQQQVDRRPLVENKKKSHKKLLS